MPELTETEIISRYRKIYGLDESIGIEHALKHWDLERQLTLKLLETTPSNRWEIFSQSYSELYHQLPWLNKSEENDRQLILSQWKKLISPNSRIFEIGSGKAELLKYLSSVGHHCTATEITPERGKYHAQGDENLSWHITDGIHLAEFEPPEYYDVVISTGVIEHFHPEDIVLHFENAKKILRPGGRYIFTTPHIASGPHDLSKAFGYEKAVCMHLREYDYPSLGAILQEAGYGEISAIFPPSKIYRQLGLTKESRVYFKWLNLIDKAQQALPIPSNMRSFLRNFTKVLLMPDNIWLSARTPHTKT